MDPWGLVGDVTLYGVSADFFRLVAVGFDAGIYYDSSTGNIGIYFGYESGMGTDIGVSCESGWADSENALNGPYDVIEMGAGGVSGNYSRSPSGEEVFVGNVGVDNGGAYTGHVGTGVGGAIRIF